MWCHFECDRELVEEEGTYRVLFVVNGLNWLFFGELQGNICVICRQIT